MSETRATDAAETTPVYPPGRYGHRREGTPRRTVPVLIFAAVIALSLVVTIKLYQQFGQTGYQGQIVGWTTPSDHEMRIHFTVTVPAGGSAMCSLEARDYGGNALGDQDVTVHAKPGATSIDATEPVTTKSKATAGYVLGCKAP